jgi:hypothetical protein
MSCGPGKVVPKPRGSTVACGAIAGAKFDAEARVRTPDDVARLFELVVADHENEIARNADLAAHLEAGAGPETYCAPDNRSRRRC